MRIRPPANPVTALPRANLIGRLLLINFPSPCRYFCLMRGRRSGDGVSCEKAAPSCQHDGPTFAVFRFYRQGQDVLWWPILRRSGLGLCLAGFPPAARSICAARRASIQFHQTIRIADLRYDIASADIMLNAIRALAGSALTHRLQSDFVFEESKEIGRLKSQLTIMLAQLQGRDLSISAEIQSFGAQSFTWTPEGFCRFLLCAWQCSCECKSVGRWKVLV